MVNERLIICFALAGSITATALAQTMPSAQQIDADLAGQYSTTQAQPEIHSHGDICKRVEKILIQQGRYLASTLHPWDHDTQAMLLTHGGSLEADIRPNAQTALGLAVMDRALPDDAFPLDFSRQTAHDDSLAILRFLLPTHGAGGIKLRDGKLWHNQWQSALWAYSAGQAAWLEWNSLDPKLKWLAAQMICDEADRFIDAKPPMQIISDTKAEENIWDSQIISLAYCMFPNHPRHEQYHQAAIRWIVNSFCTQADMKRNDVIDGKPLSQWLVGANLHEDYTLENHDRVHPDYMCCTEMCMYQKLDFAWAHLPPPQALDRNVQNIYADSLLLSFPDGGWIYPNGQDWQLHRNADWFDYHCGVAVEYNDPRAATLMRIVLQTAEKMAARNPSGPIVLPTETQFASTQHSLFEGLSQSYLLMLQSGQGPPPMDENALWKSLLGLHRFDSGQFALLRTEHSVSTFSWGRQIMGMVLPFQSDLLLTPNEHSIIGLVGNDAPKMREIHVSDFPDTLAVCGIIDRGQPKLTRSTGKSTAQSNSALFEQRFGFVALPDGRTVYVDRLTMTRGGSMPLIALGTLGILNDKHWVYHNGTRTIHSSCGDLTANANDTAKPQATFLASPWINVDDRLGIVNLNSDPREEFDPQPTPALGRMGRLEQLLQLNALSSSAIAHAKPGDLLAADAFVFYPMQQSAQTSQIAAKCKLETQTDPNLVTLHLDDGAAISFNLSQFTIEVTHK